MGREMGREPLGTPNGDCILLQIGIAEGYRIGSLKGKYLPVGGVLPACWGATRVLQRFALGPESLRLSGTSHMSAEIHFLPLYGCDAHSPASYLLRMADCTILLDCGWSQEFDQELVSRVEPYIDEIDAVLISHASMRYMGGLPHLVSRLNLHCPVYCTIPVFGMGQMMLYHEYETHHKHSNFDAFDLDDVDLAFNACIRVKYHQTMELPSGGVSITAHPAGRTVGGTMWEIRRGGESMLYAVGYNHRRELHLEGCKFGLFKRPSVVITECNTLQNVSSKKQHQRLCATVGAVLEKGGKVLMPVDATGRVLELLSVLHRYWVAQNINKDSFRLVFLSHQAYNTVEMARGQLEWMSKDMQREFDVKRDNPFSLPRLYLCHSLEELALISDTPCVVFATDATLGTGLGQEVLAQMASQQRNLVLLTQLVHPLCVAGQLIAQSASSTRGHFSSSSSSSPSYSSSTATNDPSSSSAAPASPSASAQGGSSIAPIRVEFVHKRVVPLEGEELALFLQGQADEKARQAMFATQGMDISDSDDSDAEEDDVGARELKRKKLHFMPMYPMFPANELRLAGDKFGQFIDRQQFEQPAVLETEEVPVPGDVAAEHGADDGVSEKEDAEQKAEEEDSSLEDATKTLFEPVVLSVKCAVHYIDFDGRSDGKSIRQFCKQMLPRRVILIGSAAKDKEALRDFIVDSKIVSSELMCNVPSNLQQISATSDLKMAKLHVDDDLFARLQFTAVGGTGYEAAWVTGNALPVENNPHLIQLSALAPAAAQQGDVPSPHPLVCLGVVQLARVKHILNDSGVSADFAPGGVLACGPSGQVQVEKVGKSRVRIKGALCEAYFRVRELLYSEFELV